MKSESNGEMRINKTSLNAAKNAIIRSIMMEPTIRSNGLACQGKNTFFVHFLGEMERKFLDLALIKLYRTIFWYRIKTF